MTLPKVTYDKLTDRYILIHGNQTLVFTLEEMNELGKEVVCAVKAHVASVYGSKSWSKSL